MEIKFITERGSGKLIVIFLGWGMEATAPGHLSKPSYDIVTVSDYRGIEDPGAWAPLAELAAEYDEVVTVAWSFGVRAAADFLRGPGKELPVTRRIAVNGTPAHIHDTKGIPTAIFSGTLANLSERNVRKFRRRMFASAADYARFEDLAPCARPFDTLLQELETFGRLKPLEESTDLFDCAVIGDRDAIFPPANQLACWEGKVQTEVIEGMPHFPYFQRILDSHIIDKQLVCERFSASVSTYRDNAPVQAEVARRLWENTRPYAEAALRERGDILEIGVGKGLLTQLYAPEAGDHRLRLWDIAAIDSAHLPADAELRRCDAEIAVRELPDGSMRMILSASTVQWFNNPQEFVRQACRKLAPGGVLALSTFGAHTFREITTVTGTGLRYPDADSLAAAAAAEGCRPVICRTETIVQTFASPLELLLHLKLTGVNAVSRRGGETAAAMRLIRSLGQTDGEPSLTYEPIYLVAIKK